MTSLPDAPYFDDLVVGLRLQDAPGLTLTDGHAATHQAILGDRLRLALDHPLSAAVVGGDGTLAHPALVCDVAIGQSTLVTQRVIANLFYRGLVLRRAPVIGDTLRTATEVVGLRQNRARPGRDATGLAVLRITTVDQHARPVLDFWRCAMLPLRDPAGATGHAYDTDEIPVELDAATLAESVAGWDLEAWRRATPGLRPATLVPGGGAASPAAGDVVTSAPELARLTLNIAGAHHDAQGGRRLVYGGHTIGVAAAHVSRVLPQLMTITGWRRCDHLAPVHEGDVLRSEVTVTAVRPAGDTALVDVHVTTTAIDLEGSGRAVLDWELVGVAA
jgi:acyl dehydratase